MLKSEYDRNYRWLSKDDLVCDVNYSKKNRANQEPLMDHKRRVKPAEDSVIIGEPLPSQKEQDDAPNDAYFVLGKQNERFNDSVGFYKAKPPTAIKKQRKVRSKSPPRRRHKFHEKPMMHESVQTMDFDDKMVQTSDRNKENRETKPRSPDPRKMGRVLTEYTRNYEPKHDRSVMEKPMMDKKSQNKSKWDLKLKIYNNCMSEYQRQFKPYEYVTENQYSRMRSRNEEAIAPIQKPGAQPNQLQFVPDPKPRRAVTPPPSYKYNDDYDNQSVLTESTTNQSNYDDKKLDKLNYKKVKPDQTYIRPIKIDQSNIKSSKIDQSNSKSSKLHQSNVSHPKIHLSRSPSPQPIMNRTFPPSSLLKSARNPLKLYFPHGASRTNKFRTEYSENFDNKWTLLQTENDQENEHEEFGVSARSAASAQQQKSSKWFKEIIELRKKASEYRQRSRGTHLSREHVGQVYTKEQEQERSRQRRRRTHSSRRSSPNKSRSTSRSTRQNNRAELSSRDVESVDMESELSSASTLTQQRKRVVQGWTQQRPAGIPSFDNNILLDEEASHDTDFKRSPRNEFLEIDDVQEMKKPSETSQNDPQRKYTFQKYFNPQYHPTRDNRALKYDDVSAQISVEHSKKPKSISTQSIVSSSTMSLAKETLDRARRNRDEILRQKT